MPENNNKPVDRWSWIIEHEKTLGTFYPFGPPIKPEVEKKITLLSIFMFFAGFLMMFFPVESAKLHESSGVNIIVGLGIIGTGILLLYITFRDYTEEKECYKLRYEQYYGIPFGEGEGK